MPANQYYRGDSPAVAQTDTHTIGGTPAAAQVYTITINGKSVAYTATGGDTNITIAAALQVLLAASSIEEFTEVTWVAPTTAVLTSMATVPGVPYTAASGATGTGSLVTATTTASVSPNDWSIAANWVSGSVPATGDSVFLRNTDVSILYGLAQSAVTLAVFDVDSTYTGQIGLSDFHSQAGQGGYYEYRSTYLAIGATLQHVGRGSGPGSNFIRINNGSVQTAFDVLGTASPLTQGLPVVDWLGTHASNALTISRGSLGIAIKPGTVSTYASLQIGNEGSPASDVTVLVGDGVTAGTLKMYGGVVTTGSASSTITLVTGVLTVYGSATVTTLNNIAGSVVYNSSGTVTTYLGSDGSSIDFTQYEAPRTFTNTTLQQGASLTDPLSTVTFTNPILVSCFLSQLKSLNLGSQIHIQRS